MRYAHRNADAYEAFGFPTTRLCLDPEHEGPNPAPIDEFSTKTRTWSDGRVVRYPASRCRKCHNRNKRARRARLKEENPEAIREQERRNHQNYYNKDPERYREYHRFWSDKQRREAGVPQRTFAYRNGTDGVPDKLLPMTDEFRSWLKSNNPTRLEYLLKIPNTTLQKYAKGERAKIKLGFADRIIMQVNDGTTLNDFWPGA